MSEYRETSVHSHARVKQFCFVIRLQDLYDERNWIPINFIVTVIRRILDNWSV